MSPQPELTIGKDCFTLSNLFMKTASLKGIKFKEDSEYDYSEAIVEYFLDEKMLTFLEERGFKSSNRPDCHNDIITLTEINPQKENSIYWPGNYWNFTKNNASDQKFDLRIILKIYFRENIMKRGIELIPIAHSPFLSPNEFLSNFRLFKALVESNTQDVLAVAQEIVASEGKILVSWTDIGLGGIRKLADLFDEFASGNRTIHSVCKNMNVFLPNPNTPNQQSMYIAEPAQLSIFQAWAEQLNDFREALKLNKYF